MLATKTDLLKQADHEYSLGNIGAAELTLMRAARVVGLRPQAKEQIFDRLAALAAEQGLFSSAAFWYLKVLQSKAARLKASDPELTESARAYRVLVALSATEAVAS